MKKGVRQSQLQEKNGGYWDIVALIRGIIISFAFLIVISLVIGLTIYYIPGLEDKASLFSSAAGYTAVCFGGAAAAAKAGKLGWFHGGLAGGSFILVSFIIGLIIYAPSFAVIILVYRLFWGIAIAALGGMVGINF